FEPGRGPSSSRATEAARDFDPVQQLAAPDPHSIDSILGELRVGAALPGQLDLAELILVSLDPRGFLPEGTTTLAAEAGVDHAELLAVIEQLRQVAHPALAAQDLRECFLLQLRALPERRPLPEAIVESHFADLLANRLPQIAKALEVPLGEIRVALEVLSTLDYRPLAELEPDDSMRILPDVLLETNEDGGYDVNLARDGLPELSLTRGAREALEKAKGNKRLYEHLVKKIERARWFLDAVNQRRVTLSRITQALVGRQREFLDYGPERLRPLKMQEIADEVGVHISTVSRAIRGKYAQTPQGILPLKGFFSGGQRTASGGERSRVSIQQRIREIVDAEDKGAPLSDEEVVRILRDRDGVKVARRTVTKYRLAMNIPSSNLRRSH
ncbi:MAG TPA: RNA polymerase factor sigma-54, partial [Planctomycetota bacterium]